MALEHQAKHGKGLESVRRTARNFQHYVTVFGYGEDGTRLAGLDVLDVGAGDSDFAQTVNESETIGGLVTRVDPKYKEQPPLYGELAEAAFVQNLPFPDDSFDEVISSWALFYLTEGSREAFREMLRVVRPGGKVKIFPVSYATRETTISLPKQAAIIYDEDPKKSYSSKTLQITKDPEVEPGSWEPILEDLFNKLLITDEF